MTGKDQKREKGINDMTDKPKPYYEMTDEGYERGDEMNHKTLFEQDPKAAINEMVAAGLRQFAKKHMFSPRFFLCINEPWEAWGVEIPMVILGITVLRGDVGYYAPYSDYQLPIIPLWDNITFLEQVKECYGSYSGAAYAFARAMDEGNTGEVPFPA